MLGMRLNTWHNLHFYATMLRQAREAILQRRYRSFVRTFLDRYRGV